MAVAGCSCSGKMKNTGHPDIKPFGVVKGKGFMPLVADDGTRNGIDLTSSTLEADILAAVNNPDPSKRLYMFNDIQNASAPEADANFATTDLNERYKTSDGITNVLWEQWGVSNQFFAKVASQCVDFGEYEIDICGNFKGQKEGTMLYPRPVNKNSYQAKFQGKTATTASMVSFNYDYKYATSDADQWQITASEFGVNNPLELKSLIDINLAITVDNATTLTIAASMDYGSAVTQTPWLGALVTDFTMNNTTTPAVVTITSLTANATDGEYTMIMPTQAGDECDLKAFRAASGVMLNGYESATTAFTSAS